LADTQEVLVVTLVNSAVDNFAARVGRFVRERSLLPGVGYRVRTLHGLCHDIVRERPALAGLSDDFDIVDERAANEILRETAEAWMRHHPHALDDVLAPDLDERKAEWVRRDKLPDLVSRVALSFIKLAKDLQLTPAELRYFLDQFPRPLPLLEMGHAIYADYQRDLAYRGAVDFDDLIRLALQALELDGEFLARLRYRWPYILEDEAQDSSRLQEKILRQLTGPDGNWVRVGDPNQAIYETFTTASPAHLRDFRARDDVVALDLPNSGRSMQSIMDLANYLIDWTREAHPVPEVRDALAPPYIRPTPPGDPQPNPEDRPQNVRIVGRRFSPQAELKAVADSLEAWLPAHPDATVAALVPRNQRGFELANLLREREIPYLELLRSTQATRETAGALGNVVNYLADPTSAKKLATVYRVWRRDDREDEARSRQLQWTAKQLRALRRVEDFLWPRADRDWLDESGWETEAPTVHTQLTAFRQLVRRWQAATSLPIDQLILTLAQDLFERPADLAVAHKLASVLRHYAALHPDARLPELTEELAVVARNERKFLGLGEEDTGFDPEKYKGQVVIATVHKAKGLEWDKVYLISVNDYNFPSALPGDTYISEKWFVRDRLNLEAEVLAQLRALEADPEFFPYDEGQPTQEARWDYASERLRLLYVGITRAKEALVMTWNTGRRGEAQPSAPFIALRTWWETRGDA
jgi:DNA helicase-2/ATP-dependent DNA helicase PcrA